MGKQKAPDPKSIDEFDARLADMKKVQSEKHPQRRPKWSKNKPKALKTGAYCRGQHDN
jgi:hypothetical protein